MTSSQWTRDNQPDARASASLSSGTEAASTTAAVDIGRLDDPDWRVRQAAAAKLSDSQDPTAADLVLEAMRREHKNLRILNGAISALVRNGVDVVVPLTAFLDDPDPQLRIAATLTLGERQDPRAIPDVMRALDDPDANVRFHAIEALGKLRAGDAVDALAAIAQSRQFDLAAPALDALAVIGDCSIASLLVPLLDDELLEPSAMEALGRLGDEEAARRLVSVLDSSAAPVAAAARALVGIYERFELSYRRGALIADLVATTLSKEGVEAILNSVDNADPASLPALAILMGWQSDPRIVPVLIRLLDVPEARSAATAALLRKDPKIADLVAGALSAGDPETKAAAYNILGTIGDHTHIRAMLASTDSDADLIVAALNASAKIGDPQAFETLLPYLGNSKLPVRQAAISAIHSLELSAHSKAIEQLLSDERAWIRESAVRMVAGSDLMHADVLLGCCEDVDDRVRCAAFEALGRADDLRVLPILFAAIKTAGPDVRTAAVQALAGLGSLETLPALRRALSDEDSWVRYFAARGLGELRDAESVALLIQTAESDEAMQVRVAAVDALGRIKADRAVPLLRRLSAALDPDLKEAALAALGSFAGPDIPDVLFAAADAADRATRRAGIRALGYSAESWSVEKLVQIATRTVDTSSLCLVIDALEHSPAPSAGEALVLLTGYPRCRDLCVAALSRLDASRLADLARGLKHGLVDVRRACVETLSRHSDKVALQYLTAALDDAQRSVRLAAARTLAISGATPPRNRILNALRTAAVPDLGK